MRSRGPRRTTVAALALALVAATCSDQDPTEVATATSTSTSSSTTVSSTVAPTTTTALSMGHSEVTKPAAPSTTAAPTTTAPAPLDPTSPAGGAATPPAPTPASPSPAPAQPSGPVPVDDVRVALTRITRLDRPTAATTRTGTSDLYVAERAGRIVRVAADGTVTPIANLSNLVGGTSGERGMLGLAFSADGGRLFVSYTNAAGSSVLDEIRMNGDRTGGRRTVLTVEQPFSNHNGGDVHLGPDGMLWWSLGDGGSRGDPQGNGQNVETLLGSILRIDPGARAPYGVPGDNPFVGRAGRDEIFVYGLRNPWRFSFDRATGDLWIGDVGQHQWEEIDRLAAPSRGRGANLGWNAREGAHPYNGVGVPPGHVGPIHEYVHDRGCSVTGGYVYRGARIPGLAGTYVYGDYCTSEVWGLRTNGDRGSLDVSVPAGTLVSFAQDDAGELYVLSFDGWVSRLDPA